jgi:hypothetical protein
VVSAVSASVPRCGQGSRGVLSGSSGQAASDSEGEPLDLPPTRLTQRELEVVAASLLELARRLDGIGERLAALEDAVQLSSGSTSRSTRERRSPKRSRSS